MLYKIERVGTALTVEASAYDGTSGWSNSVLPAFSAIAGAADPLSSVTVPSTHGVLVGVALYGAAAAAQLAALPAPSRSVTALDYSATAATVDASALSAKSSGVVARQGSVTAAGLGEWVEYTIATATYVRVYLRYTAAEPLSLRVSGASGTTVLALGPATSQWLVSDPIALASSVVRITAPGSFPELHSIAVIPVNHVPSFPTAVAITAGQTATEGTQTSVTLSLTGGDQRGTVSVYYGASGAGGAGPGGQVLFGTAAISSSTVVVAGTFFGAGSYALSVLATSALGLPQVSALTTPTSVVVVAYALPTAVATTVGACVLGVPVTGTATLSGPNSTVAAQYVSVSLGSAVAYGISCAGSTVTFTVVPSAVGTNALSVTVSAPFASTTKTTLAGTAVTVQGPPTSVVPSTTSLAFGTKTAVTLAVKDAASNAAALYGTTAFDAVLYAVATTDLGTDAYVFPTCVATTDTVAYTTERKAISLEFGTSAASASSAGAA